MGTPFCRVLYQYNARKRQSVLHLFNPSQVSRWGRGTAGLLGTLIPRISPRDLIDSLLPALVGVSEGGLVGPLPTAKAGIVADDDLSVTTLNAFLVGGTGIERLYITAKVTD